jgi:predicted Zn finger-like uncharacterized protein
MAAVTFQCPHCARSYSVDDSLIGRKGRCKGCGQAFALAPSGETSDPAAASADGAPSGDSPISRAQDAVLPETIGRFRVTQRLGSGAFGTVYRATDPTLGREVALKIPRLGLLGNPKALERFLREARAAASLHHPNIVAVFETGIDRGEHYIATEFIEGTTLAAAIGPGGLEPRRAAEVAAALADALRFAHAQGIVHRDVKPANVMLDKDGQPHLMDFGLARIEGATGEKLTQVGAIVGTPAYLAPEQAAEGGAEANAASDQYSLGVTLYELLIGRTPFSGPPEVVIYNLAHREIPPPRSFRREIPRDLETICLKAMARAPGDRYTDCEDLAGDLRRWLGGEPIRARRAGKLAMLRRHRVVAGLAASVVIGLLMLGGWMAMNRLRPAEPHRAVAGDSNEGRERPGAAAVIPASNGVASTPGTETTESPAEKPGGRPPQVGPTFPGAVKVAEKTPAKPKETAPPAAKKAPPKIDPDAKLTYEERIQKAYKAGSEGQWERAEKLLAGCPAESRGWEWYYCKRLSRFHPITLRGHTGPVYCIAFSTDGTRLASGGQDSTVRIWDEHGPAREPLLGHSQAVTRVAFAADGGRIISLSTDNMMIEWDVKSGKRLRTVALRPEGLTVRDNNADLTPPGPSTPTKQRPESVTARDISADARWIAGGTSKGTVRVWDAANFQEGADSRQERSGAIQDLAFSADGRWILSRTLDGWSLLECGATRKANEKPKFETVARKRDNVAVMGISPDGRYLAAASAGLVTVYDRSAKRPAWKFPGNSGTVTALAFSHDGSRLAAGAGDTLQIWDLGTGRWVTSLQAHSKPLGAIRFSPDDRRVAASSQDGNVYEWGIADGLVEKAVRLPRMREYNTIFEGDPDKTRLAGGSVESIFSSTDGARIILLLDYGGTGRAIILLNREFFTFSEPYYFGKPLSADSDRVAYWAAGQIVAHSIADGRVLLQSDLVSGTLFAVGQGAGTLIGPDEAIMIDDNSLFVNFKTTRRNDRGELIGDFSIRGVWDRRVGSWAWKHELPAGTNPDGRADAGFRRMLSKSDLSGTSFLPRTGHLVMIHLLRDSVRIDGVRRGKKKVLQWTDPEFAIEIFSARSGEPLGQFPGDSYRIHRDGELIALMRKGQISVRSLKDNRDLGTFSGGDCLFSPSGKLLATWEKAKVTVWELESKRERFQVAPASPMAFSPDERRVLAARGSEVVVKDASTGTDLLKLSGPAGRAAFTPDGSSIIAADLDRAKIWVADRPEASPRPE